MKVFLCILYNSKIAAALPGELGYYKQWSDTLLCTDCTKIPWRFIYAIVVEQILD